MDGSRLATQVWTDLGWPLKCVGGVRACGTARCGWRQGRGRQAAGVKGRAGTAFERSNNLQLCHLYPLTPSLAWHSPLSHSLTGGGQLHPE